MRAGDHDREAVLVQLREHHLAGRLSSAELEERVGGCLSARTLADLASLVGDLAAAERPAPRATMRRMSIWRLLKAGGLLVAILVFAIWGITTAQSHGATSFWPKWVWFGLAIPVALQSAIGWAWRRPRGPFHRAVVVWTAAGVLEAINIVVWALSGAHASFWPVWPLLGLATVCGLFTLVATRNADLAWSRGALVARVDALEGSRRQTVDAQTEELGRIERDLHDGAQARLVALSMQLGRAEMALEDQPRAQRLVADARDEASRAIADLRDLSRGIAPPLLTDRGLAAAVRALAARYDADVHVDPALDARRLAPALERGAYFVVAEALTNAAKHAGGTNIAILLGLSAGTLTLSIADDGRGGADERGSGLSGLCARVEALSGTMTVSSPVGAGTRLEATFPTA
jgi:signal transduction histidine kinase